MARARPRAVACGLLRHAFVQDPMRFSVFLMGDRTGTYHDMAAQVCRAEALGFEGVWLAERHFANGDLFCPSPMVVAAYLAARTRRIRIGISACVLPFHHPLQVADDALTLDTLTGGRFDLGLTRGSMDDRSHEAFGVSRGDARDRFDEHYEILRLACSGEPFSFRGRHLDLEAVQPSLAPVQRPHPPFYFVANNPASLDAAAERGRPAFLNGALDLAAITASAERYWSRARSRGQGRGDASLLLNRFVFVAESNAAAHRIMREPFLRFLDRRAPDLRAYLVKTFGDRGTDYDFLAREIAVFGDADHCVERLAEIRARAGIDRVLCTFNLITLDHHLCVESMQRFAEGVMPRLASIAPRSTPGARSVRDLAPPSQRSIAS